MFGFLFITCHLDYFVIAFWRENVNILPHIGNNRVFFLSHPHLNSGFLFFLTIKYDILIHSSN